MLGFVALVLEVQIMSYGVLLVAGVEDNLHVELAPSFLFDGEGGLVLDWWGTS